MKENRERAINETLRWEGKYSNHPEDDGGPTQYGITIADVRKYVDPNATADNVRKLKKSKAKEIYRTKYWKNAYYDCDKLAAGVDLAVFDFGVNSGPSRAKRFLNTVAGGTDRETITRLCDARLAWLKTLSDWPHFRKGWTRRIIGIKHTSLLWEQGKYPTSGKQKAATGGAIVAGGGAAVDAGTTAKDTVDQLPTPSQDVTDVIVDNAGVVVSTVQGLGLMDQVIAVLSNPRFLVAVVVVGLALGFIYWQWRRNHA